MVVPVQAGEPRHPIPTLGVVIGWDTSCKSVYLNKIYKNHQDRNPEDNTSWQCKNHYLLLLCSAPHSNQGGLGRSYVCEEQLFLRSELWSSGTTRMALEHDGLLTVHGNALLGKYFTRPLYVDVIDPVTKETKQILDRFESLGILKEMYNVQ